MTTGEGPTYANPVVANSAPRLHLVHVSKETNRKIQCRRVVTLIGSRPGCKLSLQHRSVASLHAAIVNDGLQVLGIDLVTRQGTLLNGLKMEYERLTDGDMLTVYPWQLRVDIKDPEHVGPGDAHAFGLDPTPHIVALEHLTTGRVLRPNRDVCVIGRRNGCDIIIADSSVSRVHTLLFSYFGEPAVFDLMSTNHTYVNDTPVEFSVLKNDDVITIGESKFRVRLMGSAVAERAAKRANSVKLPAASVLEVPAEDLIDIQATESSQKWRIADDLENTTRKR